MKNAIALIRQELFWAQKHLSAANSIMGRTKAEEPLTTEEWHAWDDEMEEFITRLNEMRNGLQ